MMKNEFSNASLWEQLTAYSQNDFYPFHMPGHKRTPLEFGNPWTLDITEIHGFDNLHHATGILDALQTQLADTFGSHKSFLLVNGSTCGLLAAISACVPTGGKILMSRNCHKSVYHGVYLRELTPVYLMPMETSYGILGSLSPEAVRKALKKDPEIAALLVVSPTYDGVVSDIASLADIAHSHGIPLIVDEAHGAHFPLSAEFPASALDHGADLVIQSLHKTLPAFTQTAVLHLNSELVSEEVIRRFLGIYQTSSPSYLLMASVDRCLDFLREQGAQRFSQLRENLDWFYRQADSLSYFRCIRPKAPGSSQEPVYDWDDSKILISGKSLGLSGEELSHLLRQDYHLELEMAAGDYALALCTLMDTREGFERLLGALQGLEERLAPGGSCRRESQKAATDTFQTDSPNLYQIPSKGCSIAEAYRRPCKSVPLEEAAGCISQEYVYLYPPGIPLVVPGEVLDESLLGQILTLKQQGAELNGLADLTNRRINIVIF